MWWPLNLASGRWRVAGKTYGYRLFAVCFLLLFSACGFEPVYGTASPFSQQTQNALASIRVEPIPARAGQILRETLEDRLAPENRADSHPYSLQINLQLQTIPIAIAQDGSIQRYRIQAQTQFALTRIADGSIIHSGKINRFNSFSASQAHFSIYAAEQDAIRQTMRELAEEYRLRLASHFAGQV